MADELFSTSFGANLLTGQINSKVRYQNLCCEDPSSQLLVSDAIYIQIQVSGEKYHIIALSNSLDTNNRSIIMINIP